MDTDVVIIGGGIQGVGVAQAAAAAGYSVTLVEKSALAAGTSHCSSKLIHGGLRYLESGQFSLVRKSILERERLIKLAPGLVRPVPFYIPIYKTTSRKPWQIRLGLMLYSLLGNLQAYARFRRLSVQQLHTQIPTLATDQLQCAFQYYDAQTDDAKLTEAVMRSAQTLGAQLLCPAEVVGVNKTDQGFVVSISDENRTEEIRSRVIVNAAGPWVNQVLQRCASLNPTQISFDCVQGAHIELDAPPPDGVIYVEAPQDRRAVFIMPWQGHTLVGTTEKIYHGKIEDVQASEEEIRYLKAAYDFYFARSPTANKVNIINTFAGIRVLPEEKSSMFNRPRDTIIQQSAAGFFTLYGGKLTSYRATAQQVMHELRACLPSRRPHADTASLPLGDGEC